MPGDDPDISSLRMKYSIAHSYADRVLDSPKFSFYKIFPKQIYFVGGFGVSAKWVDVADYKKAKADILAEEAGEAEGMGASNHFPTSGWRDAFSHISPL